jgi:HEAT repeat protein
MGSIFVLGLVVATTLLLVVVAVRRVWLGRLERREAEAAGRLRPAAIAFITLEEPLPADLSTYDQTVLARQLRRYSESLSGEATARIAAYFRDSEAYRQAIAGTRSRRSWRRADCAFALGEMGVVEGTAALLEALEDRNRIVRTAAARSLGRVQSGDGVVPLIEALVSHAVPRSVGADALLSMGPKIVPRLRPLAAHPDPQFKAIALTLLGFVGDSRDADVASSGLHDPSADVRVAAADALGRIGTPQSEPELVDALDDRIRHVRAAASTALGTIGTRSALARLLELARTDEFRPARAAARAAVTLDPTAVRAAADEADAGPHLREAADRVALRVRVDRSS